ncbi:MBL fold metallo-hydrolase [Streptomyces sp. M10(2022)]
MSKQTTTADILRPVGTGTDHSGRRMPTLWTRTIGELTLTYLPDAGVTMIPSRVYPASEETDWSPYRPHLTDAGHLAMGCGALLVERAGHHLLLDAGHGRISGDDTEHFQYGFEHVKDLPASLASLGVDPAALQTIAFTHLHDDHTGWARPDAADHPRSLFPNARWVVGEGELEGLDPAAGPRLAGQSERTRSVTDGTEIAEGVRAWALPGTPPDTRPGFSTRATAAGSSRSATPCTPRPGPPPRLGGRPRPRPGRGRTLTPPARGVSLPGRGLRLRRPLRRPAARHGRRQRPLASVERRDGRPVIPPRR